MELPIDLTSLTSEQFTQFIDSFDTVITDCDGVIYKASDVIPGVNESVKKLEEIKKKVHYLSNNSSMGIDQFHNKLLTAGFHPKKEDIISPPLAIIDYLKQINFQKKIFFIGVEAVKEDFVKAGFEIADKGPIQVEEHFTKILPFLKDDEDVGAVVMEIDANLNYMKLLKATIFMKRPEVLFLVGITDNKMPTGSVVLLGPGYFYRMLEDFTGKTAMVFGKPSKNLSKYVNKTFNIQNPKRTLFIGDSLHQDMSFASHCNYQKLFVLTGINNLEEAKNAAETHKPDYFISSLGDLHKLIAKHYS